jgi:hypothetical protein
MRHYEARETYRLNGEREGERKPWQWTKGKILGVICLLSIIVTAYGAWQYYVHSQSTEQAPNLSLEDINQFRGSVIVIHFMYVDCDGQINPINDQQLKQLKMVCNNFCDNAPVAIVTVAIACPNANLPKIRATYGITWLFGNDLGDGKIDIFDAYKDYSIDDGTIILIDKEFNIAQVYTEAIAADTLSSKISQLLET